MIFLPFSTRFLLSRVPINSAQSVDLSQVSDGLVCSSRGQLYFKRRATMSLSGVHLAETGTTVAIHYMSYHAASRPVWI